jgi:hypothetical protein
MLYACLCGIVRIVRSSNLQCIGRLKEHTGFWQGRLFNKLFEEIGCEDQKWM